MTHLLIAGVSTRAAAESAANAGFAVTAIDAFGDADQHPAVHSVTVAAPFTPRAAARAAQAIACDAVAYLASFENHPGAIDALAAGRALWGNRASTVRRVRDPLALSAALHRRGFPVADVRLPPDAAVQAVGSSWLVKPIASGGGHGIRLWQPTEPVPRGCYLQRHIDGDAWSVAFVAARRQAAVIAVSRQLVGDAAFGATGYQYCGSIVAGARDRQSAADEQLVAAATSLARAVTEEFDLIGVNGIDFITHNGVPYAVEVNPRWSASMELVERVSQLSVLGAHAAACSHGTLPEFDFDRERRREGASGKAIVYARRALVAGDTASWRLHDEVRDIPNQGDQISVGRPICTVFAEGADEADCYRALVARAARVYANVSAWYD
jgi:predicted ATP-grasp superfamily ATP-dependent carboligase